MSSILEDAAGHKSEGTRYQGTTPQGTGHRTQGTRHRAQGTGHQGTGHKARSTRAPGHWSTGYQSTGHQGTGHQGTGHQGTGPTKKNQAKRIAKQYIRNETGAQGEPFQEPSLGTRSRPDTTPKGHKKRKPLRQAELRKYLISDVMIYIYMCVYIYSCRRVCSRTAASRGTAAVGSFMSWSTKAKLSSLGMSTLSTKPSLTSLKKKGGCRCRLCSGRMMQKTSGKKC